MSTAGNVITLAVLAVVAYLVWMYRDTLSTDLSAVYASVSTSNSASATADTITAAVTSTTTTTAAKHVSGSLTGFGSTSSQSADAPIRQMTPEEGVAQGYPVGDMSASYSLISLSNGALEWANGVAPMVYV